MQGKLLGEILLYQKRITQEQLDLALSVCQRSGTRLGDVLVAEGIIGFPVVYQAIALHHHLPYVDLMRTPPEPELLEESDMELYLEMSTVPWKRIGVSVWLATSELRDEMVQWALKKYGDSIHFVITSPLDIRRTMEARFSGLLDEKSRLALFHANPEQSARTTLPADQKKIAAALCLAFSGCAIFAPASTLLVSLAICHILYATTMLFRMMVYGVGLLKMQQREWKTELAKLDEKTLPIYTILIPMYHETESLPKMLGAMKAMDYPSAKLDIKLVLEEDDDQTIEAAYALKPSYQFDIIKVPQSLPRTKPKACNYALQFARGEYVTVYDADDRPDADQLKKAILTFRDSPENVVCIQARLGYYNGNDNWLTRCFSLEYAALFQVMLRGLQRLHIPIPLGGTSNHFAISRLRSLGEWDPFNVTEDADLGTRLCARGFTTHMLDSDTWEEATNTPRAWLHQRTRWIKGYMQTWLVHMRSPLDLWAVLKPRGFMGFQFFIGLSTFTFLSAPLIWLMSLGLIFHWESALPSWLLALVVLNFVLNMGSHISSALYSAQMLGKPTPGLVLAALTYPFYLWLHSLASYMALWQLIVKPHFWNKTMHGKSKTFMQMQLTKPVMVH